MAGQGGVADAHVGDFREGGLERGEELAFQLAVQLVPGIGLRHVAADVGVKEHGVGDFIAVLPEAADGDVQVDACPLVHHPEGHGAGGAVLVAGNLLGVEVVDPLVLGDLAAKSDAGADVGKDLFDALAQTPGEEGGLCGGVVDEVSRLRAQFHHLALFHNHHALPIRHGDDGAGGDDVVISLVGGAAAGALLPPDRQGVGGQGLTIEKLLILVGQFAGDGVDGGANQSHGTVSFLKTSGAGSAKSGAQTLADGF